MLKNVFFVFLLFFALNTYGQEKLEWQENYKLTVLDFKAEPPVNEPGLTYHLVAKLTFHPALSGATAKKLSDVNSAVTVVFVPEHSWLHEGEGTEILLKYAQMELDLLELYARKYRQQLYNSSLKPLSLPFVKQTQQALLAELETRRVQMQQAGAESDISADKYHQQILREIASLALFCKACRLSSAG
ncbi:hypothetical protein [Adhaeribacter aquaticus]|uniref:hypothetical protein n=1 Tax=Adhaeribacter aquaticus TaxID=299567 RepID=UPI00041BCBE9|nr:hypothetical protein [Adhaeribacter aquaticus]